ncbi:hypothetical protein CEN44_15330 [Fischerella muscicola CCMEE 5323]|uniref:Asparagine synthetase domain-containing protein n=1 Tax=Fischerella muscicola CCMEE 5323 TaxID=2019572 RepID=A0A2N6K1G7_FISMU|nr:hypothetical protein [Fischerella muscicola]PLZ88460.1 hypothetical protein CEN44_15330 [Fischerella muscicola CCMEE 5323]
MQKESVLTNNSPLMMRPHRRQFVIGSEIFRVYDDWHYRQFDTSTWISYCPELRATWTTDADGSTWVILGVAVETQQFRSEPQTEIAQTASADVPNLYASWAGRWVLIGNGQVHMDASGLLGCFYGTTRDGQVWISSSPALLADILSPKADSRQLYYQRGLSWFTPPLSRFVDISRLLPSQVIKLKDGSIQPRPLLPPINPDLDYQEALELLSQSMITALRRLYQKQSKVWLGLSAGVDSRLVLAMAYRGGINIAPFTRIAARMSVADRILPATLAKKLGYKHIFLHGRNSQANRQHLVTEHSAGHVSQGDALPFLQSVRDSLEGISVGGWCMEVGKAMWRNSLPNTIDDTEICTQQIAQTYGEPLNSSAIAGIRQWLEWVKQTPQAHMDWRDRFYIEQRLAGWQSSKEQLYDLSNIQRIPIVNAARTYALMLSIAENRRLNGKYQLDLISQAVPHLSCYPCNPSDKYFGRLRAIIIKSSYDPLYIPRSVARKLRSR